MKTFKDLKFDNHHTGYGTKAYIDFENGYGVSVVFGDYWYSNGIDTYELAVMKNKHLCYSTPITNDVLGNISKERVTEAMIEVQGYSKNQY